MKTNGFHIYIIGILLVNFYASAAHAQLQEQTKFTGEAKMVIVEPNNVLTTEVEGTYEVLPYRERRPSWGKTISIGYNSYAPTNYEPNFLSTQFKDIYGNVDVPLVELTFTAKKNASTYSYGGEVSVGIYQNNSDEPKLIQSSLQVIPIRLGAIVLLDALSPQPFWAPYVSGGGYVMLYKEDNNSVSVKGNTQIAPYVNAGIAISLDWIDSHAARVSYEDSGIEASYAYVEARSMFAGGGAAKDPDLSSDFSFGGGLKVEF